MINTLKNRILACASDMRLCLKVLRVVVALLAGIAIAFQATAEDGTLGIGDMAPDFSLPDQAGAKRSLGEFRGRWIVLYFYPKDDTPGCTTEACALRDDYLGLSELGAQILGVSLDSAESHAAFTKKHGLPFPLLVDEGGQVAEKYGALWGIWPLRYAKRHTFVINPEGKIVQIYRKVDPKSHSQQLISDLRSLQQAPSP